MMDGYHSMFQVAHLMLFITACVCEWAPPPHHIDFGPPPPPARWSVASMEYAFEFPISCDVNVIQTMTINYTSGVFSQGYLFIPQDDYDELRFDRIDCGNSSTEITGYNVIGGVNGYYKIHYSFSPPITAPTKETFVFKYTAIQATKTYSQSGSSKNSFSWRTITKELNSTIDVFNVVANFYFHIQADMIEAEPQYTSVSPGDQSTTVYFATLTNVPLDYEQTHEISFPKRITCKPASSYKIVAVAVVAGSILFAVVTTVVALIVRKIKQRNSLESFEQLDGP